MKHIIHIFLLTIITLSSCSKSLDYKIDRVFKSLVDNDNCKVEYYYPKYITEKANVAELNKILERYADIEYYAHKCDEAKQEKTIINGDFKITLQTDSILSIEFITRIIHFGGNRMDTVYHSLVINPDKIDGKEFSFFQLDPEFMFPNFDREVLKSFVEKYNKEHNKSVNILAYETGSNYVITWGLSSDKFILYVGGEGEWFGYDKIKIPIDIIKNNR